jgi:hypothetical protein
MVNYNQAKIYKIWSPSTGLTYIGSTCSTLSKRISQHKDNKTCYEAGKRSYVTSFKVLDQPDARIDLIEYFPCNNKIELNRREGEIIVQTQCINKQIAGQTRKEYQQNNKEKISERSKEYRQNNKEKISERNKEYRQKNKDAINARKAEQHECMCGKIYTLGHKTRHEKTKWHIEYIENLECED